MDADPSSSQTAKFHITNPGFAQDTFNVSVSCTGIGVASCLPGSSSRIVAAGADSMVNVTIASASTLNATGTVSFLATRASDATVRDSGSQNVTVSGSAAGTSITSANPGSSVERDLCLSVAMGVGAAYECGDLRLAHALPTVRTLNVSRAPVLLYSSRQAHPLVVVGADVGAGTTALDSVIVLLRGQAGDSLAGGRWGGSGFPVNSKRRVAVSFDALAKGYSTGIYPYSLIVRRKIGGTVSVDSVTGEFSVVNRAASPFGPGWWLAGLEHLYKVGTDLLWVGGDGSTRRYVRQTGGTAWAAASLDRPDTIKIVTSPAGYYERYLPHKLVVRFDTTTLQHVQTVNRLGQVTRFYSSATTDRLDSIVVPAGVHRSYAFHYDVSSHLRSVDAPALAGIRRMDSLLVNGSNQITSIHDPDGSVVAFLLDGTLSNRINARIDQRQDTLSFTYGAGGALAGSSLSLDATHVIAQSFQPSETRGIAGTSAATPALTSTFVDGPRTDVGDTMRVWTDRFGAPRTIRNAYGDETILARGNTTYPALVTRMQSPNGNIVGAQYDARGNIVASTDSSVYDATRSLYATSTFKWDPVWDFVAKSVRPEGDNDSTSYDPANGNRLWQQDGRGSTSRASFSYYSTGITAGLLRATQVATGERDSVAYDATLGNLWFTKSPLGFRETMYTDSLGRIVRDSTPVSAAGDTAIVVTHAYDLLDRDTLSVTEGGSVASQMALRVRTGYDSAGNARWVRTRNVPDPNAIDTVTRTFTYDRANRKTNESLVTISSFDFTYDLAGNVLSDGRTGITAAYDALGRPTVRVGIDSAHFVYDEMGQVLHAANGPARNHRHYDRAGRMLVDTTQLAANDLTAQNYSTYVSTIAPRYDLDGRRSLLAIGSDTVRYRYDAQWGALDTLTDPFGHRFVWQYDDDGRMSQLVRFAERSDTTIVEAEHYDADSKLRSRKIARGATNIMTDSMLYDFRGKVIRDYGNGDTNSYTPLGLLKSQAIGYSDSYDAAGNRVTHAFGQVQQFLYVPHTDRLNLTLKPAHVATDTVGYSYTSRGELQTEIHTVPFTQIGFNCGGCLDTAAEIRLTNSGYVAGMLTWTFYTLDTFPNVNPHYQQYHHKESYRYDAFGRRVWVELVRDTSCTTHDVDSDCSNFVRHVTWDGDQILRETQVAADTAGTWNPVLEGGSVTYVHGGRIDEPLEAYKSSSDIVLPYTNWHGQFVAGTCPLVTCSAVAFPLVDADAYDGYPGGTSQGTWFGTLIKGQLDVSGYEYKRNRYYNPATGRFNSEDPAGLAGGLNEYGFAKGDPTSYSDPFGLCPWCEDQFQQLANAGAQRGGALGWVMLNAGAAGNFFLEFAGVNNLFQGVKDLGNGHPIRGGITIALSIPAFREGESLFASEKLLASHFEKHAAEFGVSTAAEYLASAQKFFAGSAGTETFMRGTDEVFYKEATNEFGVLGENGTIRTYFKPIEGRSYFDNIVGDQR